MNIDDELGDRKNKALSQALGSRDKLPETPDFKEWGPPQRRGSPFILTDYGGSNAYKETKP